MKTDRPYSKIITDIFRQILWLLILSIMQFSLSAQNSQIKFDNYTVDNGLSHNYIDCIYQDKYGWIWLGTGMGIERFDGYKFKEYGIFENDSLLTGGMLIRSFFEDSDNTLFVCIEEYGLAFYNREQDSFERFTLNDKIILSGFSVKSITQDRKENYWAATKKGVFSFNVSKGLIHSYHNEINNTNSISSDYVRKVLIGSDSKVWIATQKGLNILDPSTNKISRFGNDNKFLQDDILEIYEDNQQRIWAGTTSHAIVILDKNGNVLKNFIPEVNNERSYKISVIMQDSGNKFWIGTRGGIFNYDEITGRINKYESNLLEDNSLIHNSILDIREDRKGDLWIGTRGGLSYMVREKQAFVHYGAIPDNNKYLNNSEIYCFWIDDNNNIWIGTEAGGVNILDRKSNKFRYISENQHGGLNSNCIKAISPDGLGNILIGTYQGGLNVYNMSTGIIKHFLPDPSNKHSISGNDVWSIERDKNGKIWISTNKGLDQYNPETSSFHHLDVFDDMEGVSWIKCDSENDLWIGSRFIRVYRPTKGIINMFNVNARNFYEDKKGRFWIASEGKGLVKVDKYGGIEKIYNEKAGLANNLTYCILEDNHNMLWISTANGLSCFNPETESFRNYDKQDGLQGNQFTYGAAIETKAGELVFGGINGFNIFKPDDIKSNQYEPPVYLTDFKIFNQSIEGKKSQYKILEKSITSTDYIKLPYKYNVITFEFTALNYTNSLKNKFRYKLEGFDNEWITATNKRSVTYTNLNPGEYVFKFSGSNNNNIWNKVGKSVTLNILPPIYKTLWFKLVFFVIIFAFVVFLFVFVVKRKNLKNALVFEKEKAKKLHELDIIKLQFFTNISHEIKTPLTLIMSPLEKMLKFKLSAEEMKKNLRIMHRNANQLLNLVTQLLDYRKLEAGKLKLELKKGDVVLFCREIISSFQNLIDDKNINLIFKSVQNEINTFFDPDKLKKIINNILSNAIKFSNEGGKISVFLSIVFDDKDDYDEKKVERYIKIVIKDNGIGIQEKNPNTIFNRFYRSSVQSENPGTGIGLAFTKELVELHNGKIYAENIPDEGATFTVLLPYVDIMPDAEKTPESELKFTDSVDETETGIINSEVVSKKILLIVEDNKDVRSFLTSHFEKDFQIVLAKNGKEGIELALKTIPDAIISDIMMPVMNGTDMCDKLKKDERTSHIPIVLLTALSSKENVMEGLVKGADDYITKPFDIILLQTKLENLLIMRNSLREKYSKELILKPSNISISSPDERFLHKAIKLVEKNIDDSDLDIEKFVTQIGVSRMQLYRKIAALTNMTVKEFINDIRLKRAAQLIRENKLTISEVSYSVGFNDISYFGKCFRKKFGMSATVYAAQESKFTE